MASAAAIACAAVAAWRDVPALAQDAELAADAVEVTLLYTVNNFGYTSTCG